MILLLINDEWVEVGMFLIQGTAREDHYLIIDRPITNNRFSDEFFLSFI
ncbi:MAG: hypothetical protein V4538_03825 [Bacteroidota bacterium]